MLTVLAASVPMMPFITGILSFVFAGLTIGGIAAGLYLLFAPGDTLVVVYQNYHLRKSMRPLKDEDFSHPRSIVLRLRCLGVVCLLVAAALVWFLLDLF